MKKYFYIIHRDGQIFEIEFTEERFRSSFEQWQKGGLLVFANIGIGINTADITKILNEDQYANYIDTSRPTLFIKNGVWYDIKEKKVVRYEKWKELELEEKKKNQLKEEDFEKPSPEQMKELLNKYRPDWINSEK